MFIFKRFFERHQKIIAAPLVSGALILCSNAYAIPEIPICPEPLDNDGLNSRIPIDDCNDNLFPGIPSRITVPSSNSSGSFSVTWSRPSGFVSRYELYQNQVGNSLWSRIYSGSALSRSVTASDGTYRYRVRACNSYGCGGYRLSSNISVAVRPGTPSEIEYAGYTNSGNVDIDWRTSTTSGVTHSLDQSKNNGSWTNVYSGSARSRNVSLDNGNYRFRVRSCNSNGCSSYRYGDRMVANKPETIDLYAQYPFLVSDDAENEQYAQTAKTFRGEYKYRTSAGRRGSVSTRNPNARTGDDPEDNFNLGQGFDRLNSALAEACLNFNHDDYRVFKAPSSKQDVKKVTFIRNTSDLFKSLDISDAASVDLTTEDVSANISSESRRLLESLTGNHSEVFVARVVENRETWSVTTQNDPIKRYFVDNMLSRRDSNGRNAFRQRCGDQYIGSTDLGAKLYLVFSYDSKSFATNQVSENNTNIEVGIQSILDGAYSSSQVQQFRALLQSVNMSVEAYTLGGPENIETGITINNFNTKIQEFVNGTNESNYRALALQYRNYPHPISLLDYNYYDIFNRFLPDMAKVRRWNFLDAERRQRCKTLETYEDIGGSKIDISHCDTMGVELKIAKDYCATSVDRINCEDPATYFTAGISNPSMPGVLPSPVNLYHELGNKIDYLRATSETGSHNDSVTGGAWNKKCIETDKYTCLTNASCFEDTFQGYDQGLNRGFGLDIKDYHSPGGGGSGIGNNSIKRQNGRTCVNTYIKACTKRIGGSKARIRFDHEVFGRCPEQKAFSFTGG